ncbi:response regulator receiver sensor signal transduction histidine kinase [Candidatus Vecturithrix granuli]|uniref:histidine kinase n=1 Tax=Vecturithrix granuli TaxID=1499967 RepID=A0A081C609_VECG1|nr:response regulator receiver sensor signal transduction histidine kinase [Candidatus Vecturithrix granuli]
MQFEGRDRDWYPEKHEYIMQKGTILVIDDSPKNLRIFLDQLTQVGFKILIAPGGQDALQQLEQIKPDLILLDVLMPDLDGFETCARLKANESTKNIPVIFMTALSDPLDKVKGFEVGGVDYITKPFQYEEAIARIHTHLMIYRLQQQLEEQNNQLKQLNESKDKFFSMIAHDLRSPFSSLRGLIQFTSQNMQGWSKTKIEEVINILEHATDNLYALIENLLTWSRIHRDAFDFQPQYLHLQKIVAQEVELFNSIAGQKHITLINHITEPLEVYADANMLDAVLRNLLSNAIKFTYPGGRIDVAAAQDKRNITISVTDTGIGLSQENIAKLFRLDDRYKQLGTAKEKGTGLGLILCKEFIEKNGGTIGVTSQPDQGSTFFFTLPRVFVKDER